VNSREENLVRSALRRVDPPAGFAERVLARLPAEKSGRKWYAMRGWRLALMPQWAPAAAVLLIAGVVLGSWEAHQIRERKAKAEQAKVELLEALQITSAKIQYTRGRVFRALTTAQNKGGLL